MKKIIALFLVLILTLFTVTPIASAVNEEVYEKRPLIYIRGNGDPIYTADGRALPAGIDAILGGSDDGEEDSMSKDAVIEAAANIILPFLTEGMLMDKWDNYSNAIYEELYPLFEESALDENGNAQFGTVVSPEAMWDSYYRIGIDYGADGAAYKTQDYKFCYDYRLSPYDHVDRLHEYILTVMETTGYDEVCLSARCMGGSLLNAYLEAYGHLGHVKKVFYSDVLSNGHSLISDCFSGKIAFNDAYTQLYAKQLVHCGETGEGQGLALSQLAAEIVDRTIDLFVQTGTMDAIFGTVEGLYDRLYQALVPALVLATGMGTMPNYWVSVYEEDMDTALDLIFGKEGSEKRAKYAGLIEKIQYYREHVSSDLPGFYKKISEDYGIEVGVMARYGYVNLPIVAHYDELNDGLVGLQDSSLGATCATPITTLSDAYIAGRIAADPRNAKYISPDKMVDVSTCMFPETTWVIKNSHHDREEIFNYMAEYYLSYSNVTASSNNRGIAQFLMQDRTSERGYTVNMTEDNCASFEWLNAYEKNPTLRTKIESLLKWVKSIFGFIVKLFKGEISLGD